jgi:hypothetical protein
MDFLKLHINGKPALFKIHSIEGIIPALDGKTNKPKANKCVVVSNMEGMTHEVDETFDEVFEALTAMELEIIEFAND